MHLLRALLPWTLAACAGQPPTPQVTASLLGANLISPQLPAPQEPRLQLELEADLAAWKFQPTEMHAIWVGRRLGYLGRYTQAIDWYRNALETFHDSYRLRRHLGHRFLTVRQLDAAISTLSEARSLAAEHPNRLEPDGAPGPSGEPCSSTHGNIDYHLALAHYLRGEFNEAADLWMGCVTTWARNDDSRIAALHWLYVSLIRAGRAAEAELVQIYRGQLAVERVLERELRSPGSSTGSHGT